MNDFIKGNFTVQRAVIETPKLHSDERQTLIEELKQRVLTTLGGSMVYMERTGLTWDGDTGADDVAEK